MRLQEIQEAPKVDEECSQVRVYCLQGWPAYMPHQPLLRPYWESRGHLSVVDDLLMYDDRLVIPRGMRLQILDCIHTGHLESLNAGPGPAHQSGGQGSQSK